MCDLTPWRSHSDVRARGYVRVPSVPSSVLKKCQEVLKKNAVAKHYQSRCSGANAFTCIDCFKTFDRQTIIGHTSCTTEEDKWHGQYAKSRRQQNRSSPGSQADQCERSAKKQKTGNDTSGARSNDNKVSVNSQKQKGDVLQWQGDWTSTVEHILKNQPKQSMAWKPLADKAVDLYLASKKNKVQKGTVEIKEMLVNTCLAAIPEKLVNDKDEFVRLSRA
ncbi:LYAR-type C2HC zinc finger protein [Toxoplasma gondii VEG]|uniref:LYAR-type C2HC zinc finger protein n=2 Tax=Toxoplasma gondii TaxID=5811 RepID=V4YW71_TOXGV|nr:LYAR-type C2HC zinc finger protein [Toxoplasma gondii VEG]KFG31294.1 LYAR-type C2HC zinc finger protein [Toxoplasma gondii p89]